MPDIGRIIASRFLKGKPDDIEDIVRRHFDKLRRQKIAKLWHVSGLEPSARVATKRAIKSTVRKTRKIGKRNELSKEELLLIDRRLRRSPLLDQLYPERTQPGGWITLRERGRFKKPEPERIRLERFSFLDDPEGTIQSLRRIASAESFQPEVKIDFADRHCLDVAPFMLLVECWREMLPVFQGGFMDLPMQKVLAALNIEYALEVTFKGVEDFNDVWAFPLTRRRGAGTSLSKQPYIDVPTRDTATDRFVDALDDWLGRPEINMQLTQNGRTSIKPLLAELLENAERHSDGERQDGTWLVSGFLAKRKASSDISDRAEFVVQLGIVSTGDTFAESLQRARPEIKERISKAVASMRLKGANQSTETLFTLAALQDGVTCDPEADGMQRGGIGLMEMLEMVCDLGWTTNEESRPEVTIVSGGACIQLRWPYIRPIQTAQSGGARSLWCNEQNNATLPPSSIHVFDLRGSLPGTAISIRFRLDPDHLTAFVSEGKTPNAN